MTRTIITVPSKILTVPVQPVIEITEVHIALAEEMQGIMYQSRGIGLAANQIGELVSLIVIDIDYPSEKSNFKPQIFFNPKIIHSFGSSHLIEGCLSVPGLQLGVVRPSEICVVAQDTKGRGVKFEASGMLARVLQHEIDHLNGHTLYSKLSKEQKRTYLDHLHESRS
jgi:peptide deformylase